MSHCSSRSIPNCDMESPYSEVEVTDAAFENVGVVGSRGFRDYPKMKEVLDKYDIAMIISGGASGADHLAECYAKMNKIELRVILPDWSIGKRAGPERNKKIVAESDVLVAFWDGTSPGTRSSIKLAEDKGIPVNIVYF